MIDPRSQNNKVLGNGTYNSESSTGLDVNVRKDANGNPYITVKDTGVPVVTGNESGLGSYNWYGEGDFRLVKEYISSLVKTTLTITDTAKQDRTFNEGDIIRSEVEKKNNNGTTTIEISYYIAIKSGTQKISNTSIPLYDPTKSPNNIFVKFNTQDFRYWHENDRMDNNNVGYDSASHSFKPKTIKERGTVLTMDNGDVYVYKGDATVIPYSGINDDWFKIGNIKGNG